jgi:DNA invertase Pin-like site-specific DNA recombinase
MKIGYARVSTDDQDATSQVDALKKAGVTKIHIEKASGGRWDRPVLQQLLEHLREGDQLVVWKLDRLSRSLLDLLRILNGLEKLGAGFQSLTEHVDTTTPAGRMLAQILGSFAEFERSMIRERTRAGLVTARKQGRIGGRPPKLSAPQLKEIAAMLKAGRSQAEVARLFAVSASTICRIIPFKDTKF